MRVGGGWLWLEIYTVLGINEAQHVGSVSTELISFILDLVFSRNE
jgi:hypothetical protein